MRIINPYYYSWYSYFISPYLFTSPISNINDNKRIHLVPFPTVIPIKNNNYPPKYNISETDIQKFIQRIKKYEFPKEMKIPLEEY